VVSSFSLNQALIPNTVVVIAAIRSKASLGRSRLKLTFGTPNRYICPPAIEEPGNELAQNAELGEALMKLTREIVKEKFGTQSVEKGCPLKDY
jgi:hypothetical protein